MKTKTLKIVWIYVSVLYSLLLIYLFIYFVNIDTSDSIRTNHPVHIHQDRVYPTYYADNLHSESEWSFNISKNYNDANIYIWSEAKSTKSNTTAQGIGENGTAFHPTDDLKGLMDQLLEKENYNLLASDMMSLHRSLPDSRPEQCKNLSYPDKLPNTSVIIIFHNEAWTTLLRTVWSVIERSPRELINEIILVDDASTEPCLKRPLDDYLDRMPIHIKLIRNSKREGLIRARLIGAKQATGNVLTFLDAHIECSAGWLQPLLARIASDRSVISVPVIDTVSSHDMSYFSTSTKINGFRPSLIFTWMPVPERERIRTHDDIAASLRTPTMVGCAFSIDREFFFEIGAYDEGMDIWGSENMEMSLRVWQCGGSLEIIPCSHVGHLFRISTYSFGGDVARIKARNNIKNVKEAQCIDTHPGTIHTPLVMFGCHGHRGNQLIFLTKDQMLITRRHFCIGVDDKQYVVKTVPCEYRDSHWWKYDNETKWMVHMPSGQCMQGLNGRVILGRCDTENDTLKWEIESTP